MNRKFTHSISLLAVSYAIYVWFAVRYDPVLWDSGHMNVELLAASSITAIAIIKSFKNRYFLLSLLPVAPLALYMSGWITNLLHGGRAFSASYCDMGMCSSLNIMNDGVFYYINYCQIYPEEGSEIKCGTSIINGNQILLYANSYPPQQAFKQHLRELKAKNYIHAKAIDFQMDGWTLKDSISYPPESGK